jgi:hypothetical protein
MSQFVCFRNGEEKDWIDPVLNFTENDEEIIVDNGYYIYIFAKDNNGKLRSEDGTNVFDKWEIR